MKRVDLEPKHGAAAILITALIVFVLYELFAPGAAQPTPRSVDSGTPGSAISGVVEQGEYRLESTSWLDDGSEARRNAAARAAALEAKKDADPRVVKLSERLQGIDIAIGRGKR